MRTTGELKVSFITTDYSYFCLMMIKYKRYQIGMLKKTTVLFFLLVSVQFASGQIVGSDIEEGEKEEKIEKDKVDRDSLMGTTFYLTGLYNYSFRKFEDNSVYGSFSSWEDQTADRAKGLTVGVFLPIVGDLSMDIGLTYFGHKEKYDFEDENSDSTYHYSQSYMQLGVPIKLRYTYGDEFQIFGFAGVTPLNILNVRYKANYTTAIGTAVDSDLVLIKDKLSIFNIMGNVGMGITYNMDWVGITVYPEYRHHFLNSYDKQKPIVHKMYGFGINAGLTLRF
jgi:hypothetical protein